MSIPSSGNLNELETKVSDLERVNFDLKMQLYYLSQKQVGVSILEALPDSEESEIYDSTTSELLQLKEEQEYARRRMAELESEVLQLQIIRENDIENSIKARPVNMTFIEENRKRERDAAMAIAEHDAAVIRKLQSDILSIQQQHESDKDLVNSCAEKLAQQLEVVASKDNLISELSETVSDLKHTISSLSNINTINDIRTDSSRFLDESHYDFSNSPRLNGSTTDDHLRIRTPNNSNGFDGVRPSSTGTNNYDDITVLYYRNEVSKLKMENNSMREKLDRQTLHMEHQEEAVQRLSKSASDLSHMGSDEVSRLGAELDRCIQEKEMFQVKCFRLEQQVQNLVNSNNRNGHDSSGMSFSALAGGDQMASHAHHLEMDLLRQDHAQTVDMYRQREAELLLALEGVVQRCQELESQIYR